MKSEKINGGYVVWLCGCPVNGGDSHWVDCQAGYIMTDEEHEEWLKSLKEQEDDRWL